MIRRIVPLLLAGLLACACGGGYGTPEETLETLRAAVAARDGATLYASLNAEARAYHCDWMRLWKARVAAGNEVGRGPRPLPADELKKLSEQDAVRAWLAESSGLVLSNAWFGTAVLVEGGREDKSEDEVRLLLRGRDGEERPIWFLREDGRWRLDFLRTGWAHR